MQTNRTVNGSLTFLAESAESAKGRSMQTFFGVMVSWCHGVMMGFHSMQIHENGVMVS